MSRGPLEPLRTPRENPAGIDGPALGPLQVARTDTTVVYLGFRCV